MAEVARTWDPHATVARGVAMARRLHARLDEAGDDRLGRARTVVHEGSSSAYNRMTRRVSVGVGAAAAATDGRLSVLESILHELAGHKWMDARAGWGGLLYAGSSGRLSEGLAQVMAAVGLTLEGADEIERAYGWTVLDPRGQTAPVVKFPFRTEYIPLSTTMDDVRRIGFTTNDQGLVHVHRGIVQAAHLDIASALGMEQMAKLTVVTAHRELKPTTGIARWAAATVRTADRTWGAAATETDVVRHAWDAAKVALRS